MAAPKKGNDTERKLRLPAPLNADVALLAELHHRSGNDEMIVALEAHREKHAAELAAMKRRRR